MFSFLLSFIPNISIFSSIGSKEQIQNELSLAIADLDARCSEEHHKRKFSNDITTDRQNKINHSDCFKKYGVLTDLQANHGIIDKLLLFDVSIAGSVWHDLKIGSKIQYLAYKISDDIPVKVVKILSIVYDEWNKPLDAQATDELLDTLRLEKPEYFSVHQRSVLGVIMERKGSKMSVECDNKNIIYVDLETVQTQFVPMVGDLLCLNCNVQSDATFVDMSGEILDVISIYPTRSKTIKGKITVIKNGVYGHIDEEYFFLMESAEMGYRPTVGDIVIGDAIESNQGVCTWRCIKIVLFQKNVQKSILNVNDNNNNSNNNYNDNNENKNSSINKSNATENGNSPNIIKSQPINGIEVTDNLNVTLNQLNEVQFVKMIVKNTSDKQHQILRSTIMESKANSQVVLKKPRRFDRLYLQPMEEFEYLIEIRSKFIGKNVERLAIQFEGNFRILRYIEINVNIVDDGNDNNDNIVIRRPTIQKRFNTAYTKEVWNKTGDIIPGEKLRRTPHFISVRLPQFEVPLSLQKVLEFKSIDDVENHLDNCLPFFCVPLTITNYAQCFQSLLHLEEIQAFHNIRIFDMERAHFTHDNGYLVLHVENIQESRPSLVIGDSVRVTNPWISNNKHLMYEGMIHKVQKDNVLIKFTKNFHDKYNGEDYQVEFFFSRYPFRKQHYAVKRAVQSLGQDLLFPTKLNLQNPQLPVEMIDGDLWYAPVNKMKEKLKWFNGDLNTVQKEAVVNILNGVTRPMPYIIFGPPGTGKTVTVIETILQICCNVSESRIIVATSSNSAANLITERLIESNVLKPGDFIRIVGHNSIEREMIPEHLLPYCGTCDIGMEGTVANEMLVTDSGLKLRCSSAFLGRHKITIATCLTIGTLLQMKFPRDHFTHVIIDECGQCRETESMIPMVFINPQCGQIILAGDPMQLGPVILNKSAVKRGFDKSLLVRLLERFPYQKDNTRFEKGFDSRLVTKLLYNYRALPSVMKMYNELFYDSELISTICERTSNEIKLLKKINKILPNCDVVGKTHGIFFIGINGTNQRCADSPSWFNSAEVRSIFVFLIKLYEAGCTSNDIGIISPYQQQVKSIRLMIRDANLQMPKVGSVEEFQGQERNIILISTVRSTKALVRDDLKYALGFVENSKRLNVAISRARALVVIFGNSNLLIQDQSWKTLIQHCVDNNAYAGCPLSKQNNNK